MLFSILRPQNFNAMPTLEQARYVLQHTFGYPDFRLQQAKAIENILQHKDTLVLMPTGGGKSLCFQIPALLFEGLTVVISPLISLMKDQVDALRASNVAAAFLNSSQSTNEQNFVLEKIQSRELKLLYVAPERLMAAGGQFLNFLQTQQISLVAIDEAHCISSWGHDFRPDYAILSQLRQRLPHVPFVALTATADKRVRQDILNQLDLTNPQVFLSSFNRPNINYEVQPKRNHYEKLLRFLATRKNESGIIYCLSRSNTELIAEKLRADGYDATHYHAGLTKEERDRVQEKFIRDDLKIITATIAFGMGIDKPNVRYVVHADLPKNIEGYYQETGRAGRDGLPSEALLFYSFGDVKMMERMVQVEGNPEQTKIMQRKLRQMSDYGNLRTCRRQFLLKYFDETFADKCGNCDNCTAQHETIPEATVIAQKALSAVVRLKENYGMSYVVDFLRGSQSEKIRGEHKELKTFGIGKELSKEDWMAYIRELLAKGYLLQTLGEFPVLKLTQRSQAVLYKNEAVTLTKFKTVDHAARVKEAPEYEPDLLEMLKVVRKYFAVKDNVPAYIVLNDYSLQEMATYLPQSLTELRAISGFGDVKIDKYGKKFLEPIADYCGVNNLGSRMHLKNPKRERKAEKKISEAPKSKSVGTTHHLSFRLFQEGKTVGQIALERKLNESTILSHLEIYVANGSLSLSKFVSSKKKAQIEEAIAIHGTASLKLLKQNLDEAISYNDIQMVVAGMK